MRVLFIGINYWPEETGIGYFNTWRCEFLASRGHEVTICTGFPYYPQWRIAAAYRGRWWQRETHKGVGILRSRIWVPNRVSSAKRVLFEASFLASSFVRALGAKNPDVLVIVSPPLGLALTGITLAAYWNIPYVFHVEDLQPDAAADLGMLPGPALRLLYGVEKLAYKHAALVSTLTAGMEGRILAKGVPKEKVAVFSHDAEQALFHLREQRNGRKFRDAFGLNGKFLAIHSGNMGVKQGLEVVLGAAQRTGNCADIVYLLVGDGAMRKSLQEQAAASGLDNVRVLPLQPRDMFRDMLVATDVALVTQQKSVSDIVFPSKVVTLLASGCPVVASVNSGSQVARVVGESGGGVVLPPEDPQTLADAVVKLRNAPETLAKMSTRARKYAREHWAGDHIMAHMERELVRIAQQRPSSMRPAVHTTAGD